MKTMKLLKIGCVICAFLVTTSGVVAQSSPTVLSTRAYGLGDAGVTFQDIHSVYSNQAGLVHLDSWALHATASRRFELSELTQVNLAYATQLAENGALLDAHPSDACSSI